MLQFDANANTDADADADTDSVNETLVHNFKTGSKRKECFTQ